MLQPVSDLALQNHCLGCSAAVHSHRLLRPGMLGALFPNARALMRQPAMVCQILAND